jgi:uncharacterized protein (TIGR01777 family)
MENAKKILITGATGLIGSRLTEILVEHGHAVVHLSRSKKDGPVKSYVWNVEENRIDPEAFENVDTIIHLAGAGIADKPWTKARKREILESRTHSTRLLFNALANGKHPVRSFISASAVGYYGFDHNDQVFTENSAPGSDFLASVVRQWEHEVDAIQTLGLRVVKIRIGIVLSEKAGVLKEIMKPVKFYLGAPLGSGDQYISWIHLEDLCNSFVYAVENPVLRGPYNATAPAPVTNRQLTQTIARSLKKPLIFPAVPSFALKLFLGEMADLVLNGSQVSSGKLRQAGFQFRFTTVDAAVSALIQNHREHRGNTHRGSRS